MRWISLAALFGLAFCMPIQADWPTHRGNIERTGNIDNQPGPKVPKVLWIHKSQEHFIASPVIGTKAVYVSGLGAFNTAALHALALTPQPGKQAVWSKRAPYLKLPVVSSPAVADGKVVFGDGMHQTDGAILHCLRAEGGLPLWQLPMPGRLVHLEGSPAIANGRVYMGGGNAGVFCVELNKVALEGKDLDLAEVQKILDQRWRELLKKYEEDKKKDPDFAIPPTEDMLPKPAPKLCWQQGKNTWHVDASLAVVGDRVLAASAYLDDENVGDRTLYCLDAKDGKTLWKTPLRLNPWGGSTVAGNLVLIGCSNIRFDPKAIPGGKGEIVAVDLTNGNIKWRKEVPGGVVSPVAVKDGVAVFTATDGKVRAWDVASGQERWSHDAKAPFFAGPAVAGGSVYVADLKSVVHALSLADGKPQWTLNLADDAKIKATGMVYGSPAVHAGRLYLATCNLDGESARQPTAVVCIGEK